MGQGLPDAVQDSMPAIRVVVSGRVQGVGFRFFVARVARELGVVGSVWNCSGGEVESHAENDSAAVLDRFVQQMWLGPGDVDEVIQEPDQMLGSTHFEIGYSR